MRKLFAVSICAVAGWVIQTTAAQPGNSRETLLRWHSIGARALLEQDGLQTLRAVAAMPETATLRTEIVENLAHKAATRFAREPQPGPGSAQLVALLKPLLNDLIDSEIRLLLTSPAQEKADWALAIRLADDAAATWSTNLWKLAASSRLATPSAKTVLDQPGWVAEGEAYNLIFARKNDWILFAGGHSSAADHDKTLAAFSKELSSAADHLWKADINLPAFARITSHEKLGHAPRLSLTARPRSDGIRTEIQLDYPRNLGIKPEKWEVPKNLIRDPLIAFTAIQGLKKHLSEKEELTDHEPDQVPNQLFLWSQSLTPFSITGAANIGNPAEFVDSLAKKLLAEKNPELRKMALGELRHNSEHHSLIWSGLPIVVPFIRPAPEPHDQFVMFGLFPLSDPGTNAAPSELFEQLQKDGLVYYAWEITGARIAQWRPLWQMSRFLRNRPIPGPNSASEKWLPAIAPTLENTITEAVLEGERSLKIIRQSQLGLNALELVLLAHLADRYDTPAPAAGSPGQKRKAGKSAAPSPQRTPGRQP